MPLADVHARIAGISARLRCRGGKRLACVRSVAIARLARLRRRRERLQSELPDWVRLVRAHRGCVQHIARAMGCDVDTAEHAIWDLGLWPDVVRERNARHG